MSDPTSTFSLAVTDRPAPILIEATRTAASSAGFGFEGGRVVRVGEQFHLFTTELLSEPIWVKTALAHWSSHDGLNWTRESTIRESTGDHTGVDSEAALFSPMPIFNERDDRWELFFVAYRSEPDQPNQFRRNHAGRVLRAASKVPGIHGIRGPYYGNSTVLEPGPNSQPWEGLQGTDSFFPFQLPDQSWLGFYGSCTTEDLTNAQWSIGLARSHELAGEWCRETANPLAAEPRFIENPVVQKIGDMFIALYENDPFDPAQDRSFGWMVSADGFNWERQLPIVVPDHIASWASRIRTPLGLIAIPTGYRAYFTAFDHRGKEPGAANFGHIAAIEIHATGF